MRLPLFALCLGITFTAHGQTADGENLGSTLTIDSSTTIPVFTFAWWGKSDFHYILESSTDLLTPWIPLENFNPSGSDAPMWIQFTTNSPRIFLRAIQFDPNDISELIDSEPDELPDKWEIYYFGDLSRDGSGDWNEDGLLDRDAFRFGLNPKGDDESEVAGKFDVFSYDDRGWLDGMTITGNASVSFGLDDEGNIETAN